MLCLMEFVMTVLRKKECLKKKYLNLERNKGIMFAGLTKSSWTFILLGHSILKKNTGEVRFLTKSLNTMSVLYLATGEITSEALRTSRV